MADLRGKRILVTGASSGIGRAFAKKASSSGASLILFGRNSGRLEDTFRSLDGQGHEFYCIDIREYDRIAGIIKTSVDKSGPVSGFVHSAGIERTLPVKASTPELFREIFEINVFAGFEIARILSQKSFYDPAGSSFIFISSVKGKTGDPGKLIYCSSKSALLAGSKALALELAPKKIRCNCVLPGIVMTEMVSRLFETIPAEARQKIIDDHPSGIGEPGDIASLMCFLMSDEARWITGSEYVIDGGYSA